MTQRLALGVLLAGLAATVGPAHAQGADPMHSPECRAVRAALDALIADPGLAAAQRQKQLGPARERAAATCLGARAGAARERSGAPDPVQASQAIPLSSPPPVPALPAAMPSAPAPLPRPIAITHCDAGGCWDSAGRRLSGTGPVLIGPNGACTVQGSFANCP